MRLGSALFLAYLLIFTICFSYPLVHVANSLRIRYLESVEEPLVDQANILAALVGREMETGRFNPDAFGEALKEAYARVLSARIYQMKKQKVDVAVYITDRQGKVVFDSDNPENVGADFSGWWDVSHTLQGEYGARTTRKLADDPASAVLYVGAPIRVKGELAGVLTVAKPTTSLNAFLDSATSRLFRIGALSVLGALSLSLLVSWWVSRQIQRLIRYANDVRDGRRVNLPRLARTELRELGGAFDRMRESLEGKKYVEQYVQTLTHEIKSPVSAIQGAAELLGEEMPPEKRARFHANIRNEADRIGDLIERMLSLSSLETRATLETTEAIPMQALAKDLLEARAAVASRRRLALEAEIEQGLVVRGDPFLLHQAIDNLLQNAIDFSPAGGRVTLRAVADGPAWVLTVQDDGPGVPDYALERVFEKFFSLQRPDTGRKSTGLGLPLVREVASLHGGEVCLENLPGGGLKATLRLPRSPGDPGRPGRADSSSKPRGRQARAGEGTG